MISEQPGLPTPDPEELAWSAGFFDGEGSTFARRAKRRPGYAQLNLNIPQSGRNGVPAVLRRFQLAMLGMGHISGPSRIGLYMLRYHARAEANHVLFLLWPYLGEVKRAQAAEAIKTVDLQYESGTYVRRKARRTPPRSLWPTVDATDAPHLELAWAAGFLDAEGCFGLARTHARKGGSDWYRIRASASQHGEVATPAAVLLRLHRALGGLGRIECHGEVDDFKWVVEGPDNVARVLELVRPWLGEDKRADAEHALEAFHAQTRIKGGGTHCRRGHLYDRVDVRNGRTRRWCNACARLIQRRGRARRGIRPRQFRNVARRYTE